MSATIYEGYQNAEVNELTEPLQKQSMQNLN